MVTQKDYISPVISALMPAISGPYEPQRITVVAFFAEVSFICVNVLCTLECTCSVTSMYTVQAQRRRLSVTNRTSLYFCCWFAQLINNKCGDSMQLVETLMNALLGKLVDTSLTVRKYCIRGLGNIAGCGHDQVFVG